MTDEKNRKGVVNLKEKAALLTELWSPRVVGEVDDSYVKIAKIKGEFTWHDHQEDEFFLVLDGQLDIHMQDHTVRLNAGEFYVVPKGVMHNPKASEECVVLLFEKKTTAHTGNVQEDMTRDLSEQLRPL
ncbi:cupin domain-containing protein [Marinicella sediminis]|uniref:Cupin domain-containing protein n=1 Tax=Marinicella sediminis TaxID=1792834 RepID=A0ABV7JE87_9GAMM|nr:cupin domain-containing protein [Marinicella sediminis]